MRVAGVGVAGWAIGLCLTISVPTAGQQPARGGGGPSAKPTQPAGAGPGAAGASTDSKQEAQRAFYAGLKLLKKEQYEAALAEFTKSLNIFPTKTAKRNAAICLRKLGRHDEALEMLEALVRDFPDLSGPDRAAVDTAIKELSALVGNVDVRVNESGAAVSIDGRERGTTPLGSPARVTAGSHRVQVRKDGFAPWEAQVDVAAQATVPLQVKLVALAPEPEAKPEPKPTQPVEPSDDDGGDGVRSRLRLQVAGGISVAPGIGGEASDGCSGECTGSTVIPVTVFVRGGHQWPSGIGVSLDVGYLRFGQELRGRSMQLHEVAPAARVDSGVGSDDVVIQGPRVGVSAGYRSKGRWNWEARLGAGAFIGTSRDHRDGVFSSGALSYQATFVENSSANYLIISPEVRFGRRLGAHLDISLGVEALILLPISQPMWRDRNPVPTPSIGSAQFGSGSIAGKIIVLPLPTLAVGYSF